MEQTGFYWVWSSLHKSSETILDVGSGTGLIALMLAQRSNADTINAVELDSRAYEQTVENFERSNWADRLFCYHSSFQGFAKEMAESGQRYDLIVSNPPFIPIPLKHKTNPEIKPGLLHLCLLKS